jgi:hypothetical protein
MVCPGRYISGSDTVTIVQGAGWSSRSFRTAGETGIRVPDRPARSESLYRLSYPISCVISVLRRIILSMFAGKTREKICPSCVFVSYTSNRHLTLKRSTVLAYSYHVEADAVWRPLTLRCRNFLLNFSTSCI